MFVLSDEQREALVSVTDELVTIQGEIGPDPARAMQHVDNVRARIWSEVLNVVESGDVVVAMTAEEALALVSCAEVGAEGAPEETIGELAMGALERIRQQRSTANWTARSEAEQAAELERRGEAL